MFTQIAIVASVTMLIVALKQLCAGFLIKLRKFAAFQVTPFL